MNYLLNSSIINLSNHKLKQIWFNSYHFHQELFKCWLISEWYLHYSFRSGAAMTAAMQGFFFFFFHSSTGLLVIWKSDLLHPTFFCFHPFCPRADWPLGVLGVFLVCQWITGPVNYVVLNNEEKIIQFKIYWFVTRSSSGQWLCWVDRKVPGGGWGWVLCFSNLKPGNHGRHKFTPAALSWYSRTECWKSWI